MADSKKYSELAKKSVDQLAAEEPHEASDKDVRAAIDKAKLTELEAANEFRQTLVTSTKWTVTALVGCATLFMGLYIWSQWDHIEASVMIAYFASVVAEIIGILFVIARYLFPKSGTK